MKVTSGLLHRHRHTTDYIAPTTTKPTAPVEFEAENISLLSGPGARSRLASAVARLSKSPDLRDDPRGRVALVEKGVAIPRLKPHEISKRLHISRRAVNKHRASIRAAATRLGTFSHALQTSLAA